MPSRSAHASLRVSGKLPIALSGHYLQIDEDGMVHAVSLGGGRAISYRNRWITTDGDDVVASNLIVFGSSILALAEGELAFELDADLDAARNVDLAGGRRGLAANGTVDPHTGELHLLTFATSPSQLHVVVSRGALTRTIRTIDDAPARVQQIELTRDDVVLVADGFVGVAARAGVDTKVIWFEIDTEAHHIAGAYAHGETVIVHAIGPSLVRWTLDRRAATAHCDVLDAAPHRFATSNRQYRGAPRFLWTGAAGTAHKRDLVTGGPRSHDFGDGRTPGELVFVADPDRPRTEDGGWLVGLVHDDVSTQAEFVVLDAEAIERPAVATVPLPRRVPDGAHGTWVSTRPPRI
jgi:8'-apo-carotenoid 13,14-cleaving dioxygenase